MEKRKQQAIIVDVDNCITFEPFTDDLPESSDRQSWDEYHARRKYYSTRLYKPVKEVVNIINGYYEHCTKKPIILFLTAREDTQNGLIRLNTYRFIKKNFECFDSVHDYSNRYKILMREENDFRPSAEVKQDWLQNYILPNFDVLLAFDDDESNKEMFLKNNITTLQVYSRDVYNLFKENNNG